MIHLKLIGSFMRASTQQAMAYRANFFIRILNSLLNLAAGAVGIWVLFSQVKQLHGWDMPSALVLLGVYLTLQAIHGLFISPSFEALAGMDGEIWKGTFDFTMLKPLNKQFFVSVRVWQIFALLDLVLALVVLGLGIYWMGQMLTWVNLLRFALALAGGLSILYAVMLIFTALVFINPGFLFTWLFNNLFQLARYPVNIYPGWLKLVLTWVIPVGLMTTIPAQALKGDLTDGWLLVEVLFALGLLLLSGWVFKRSIRRYASASS